MGWFKKKPSYRIVEIQGLWGPKYKIYKRDWFLGWIKLRTLYFSVGEAEKTIEMFKRWDTKPKVIKEV